MNPRIPARIAGLLVAAVIAAALFGCGKKQGIRQLIPNQEPTVVITSAPVDSRDTASYSIQISWSGDDADGRVDHYLWAIDPGDGPPNWTATKKNDTTFTFASRTPYQTIGRVWSGESPHTFMIKAVDNLGMESELQTRSFFSTTVAPTVRITLPKPSHLLTAKLTPSMTVSWAGTDPDGFLVGKNKPIKYKYHRFENPNPELPWSIVKDQPDSLRRFYAKNNFATWDSVGGDTTSVQISGQAVGHEFIFVVVAFDTAGAYSPVFNLDTNMLWYETGYAATLGPVIHAFNESFDYRQPSGGYTPNDPTTYVNLEEQADKPVTFNWDATPPLGAAIQSYRWKLDGDVGDDTQRSNETTDWYHWSAPAVGTTSCTIGPFTPGVLTYLYIEAEDNNEFKSLLTIVIHPVRPTFESDLLIVDDTRLNTDQKGSNARLIEDTGIWPCASELDTFLYARGGYLWRETQVPLTTVPQPFSRPGLFAGYNYDTLGTRQGILLQSNGVPLSVIGKYKHLVWMVDKNGGTYEKDALNPIRPEGTLHWMCSPNHLNTLGSYIASGGEVWLLGGDAAYASTIEYNAKLTQNNDAAYGPGKVVFSNGKNELIPGRLMYDAAHWQNEMVAMAVNITSTAVNKASAAHMPSRPWLQPGWNFSRTVSMPDYSFLPVKMNRKLLTLGDSLPPTRTAANSSHFYSSSTFDAEYISQPTYITEDIDPDPFHVNEVSTLDTLMEVKGGQIAPVTPVPGTSQPVMTYYHGTQSPRFIFSGFDIWIWSRADDQKMVDFVMQQIWGLHANLADRTPPYRYAPSAARALAKPNPATPSSGAGSRLPTARSAAR